MKYLHLLFLALVILFSGGCDEQKKPHLLMVTNASFPPYEYVEKHDIVGIDPEIVRTIAERIGYVLEIQDMNFDSVIAAVQTGNYGFYMQDVPRTPVVIETIEEIK